MVLEQLFKIQFLESKPKFAFVLGFLYTIIGAGSAALVFGKEPSMMTVAFTAILLIPSLNKLLATEENEATKHRKFSLHLLFRDHKDIFQIYIFLFLGVFLAFGMFAVAMKTNVVTLFFGRQLSVAGLAGQATGVLSNIKFWSILINNLKILVVCLILSLMYGSGAILFIVWNASVWGVVFGYIAHVTAASAGVNPFAHFWITLLPTIPHLLGEGVGYLVAAIVGGIVSKAVIREEFMSDKFINIIRDAFLFLIIGFVLIIIAAWLEVAIFL